MGAFSCCRATSTSVKRPSPGRRVSFLRAHFAGIYFYMQAILLLLSCLERSASLNRLTRVVMWAIRGLCDPHPTLTSSHPGNND